MRLVRWVALIVLIAATLGCGNGGGGSPPKPPPTGSETLEWDQGNWDEENWR